MVELDAREHRRARAVVQELGSLVEVGGVVLVAFDDDVRALPEPEVRLGVERHAADEEGRIGARDDEHVRHQRRRRRLAVRAGDDDAVPARRGAATPARRESSSAAGRARAPRSPRDSRGG